MGDHSKLNTFRKIITITHVDEARNMLTGWDGLSNPQLKLGGTKKIDIPVSEILKARDKAPWKKYGSLSYRIGRIFCDEKSGMNGNSEPYKVLYMFCDLA